MSPLAFSWPRRRRLGALDTGMVRAAVACLAFLVIVLLYRSPPVDLSTSFKITTHYTTEKIMAIKNWGGNPESGVPEHLQPIPIVMFMFGLETAVEGTTALKSVFMYISRPVELHIICGPDVPPIVSSKLNLITR